MRGRDLLVGEDGYEWSSGGNEIGGAMILYRLVKYIVRPPENPSYFPKTQV